MHREYNCEGCTNIENGCMNRCSNYVMVPDQCYVKPSLGITPRFIWNEQRITDIKEAIERRTKAFEEIPVEWINEYNELLTNLNAVRGE